MPHGYVQKVRGAWLFGVIALAASFIDARTANASDINFDTLPMPLQDTDYLYDGVPPEALVDLGRDLFFDPIISGNRNISCGTCHDPALGTSDGLALGIGEGGSGAGSMRRTIQPVTGRVPRNAPALWNIGAREYRSMFHDGRLENFGEDTLNLRIPSNAQLPDGIDSLLAAQAFFPVTSAIEMAGQRGENAVADAMLAKGFPAAWAAIADRVSKTEAYAKSFLTVFSDVKEPEDLRYAHIAEALAAFQTTAFRSDDSPFDTVLKTRDTSNLSSTAAEGLALFYGEAGCSSCHSGPLLTDHEFHSIAVPQIGPGKGHGRDGTYWEASGMMAFLEDEGRYRVTSDPDDLFAFRTPSLRNVALTGPWGHSGAFEGLEAMVRHHLDATASLETFDATSVALPPLNRITDQLGETTATGYSELDESKRTAFDLRDTWVHKTPALRARIGASNSLPRRDLTDAQVDSLIAFLETLSDPTVNETEDLVPTTVPSGLAPEPRRSSAPQSSPSRPKLDKIFLRSASRRNGKD